MDLKVLHQDFFSRFATILLVVCVITLPGFTKIGKYAFAILSILSIYYVVRNINHLPKISIHEKRFFMLIIFGFVWTVVTLYVNGAPGNGSNQVWSRQFFLVMLVPLYYLFLSIKLSGKMVFWVLVLSSVVTCGVAVNDSFFDVDSGGRAHGGTNPILFGSIALSLAGCLLAITLYNKKHLMYQLFGWISIIFLYIAVILSGSRGVWLAIPVLLAMWVGFSFARLTASVKVMLFSFSLALISTSYFIPTVGDKVDASVENFKKYIDSESVNDPVRSTSLGIRLEMWKAGIKIFQNSPVFGVGTGGYLESARKNLDEYNVSQAALKFYHPHNQFVSALATKGVLGLFFVLSILLYPIFLLSKTKKSNGAGQYYKFAGVFLALSYFVYSITDVPLEGKPMIIFYVLIMALVLANLSPSKSVEKS